MEETESKNATDKEQRNQSKHEMGKCIHEF